MYVIIVIDPLSLGNCRLIQPWIQKAFVYKPPWGPPAEFVNKGFLDLRVVSGDNSRTNGIDKSVHHKNVVSRQGVSGTDSTVFSSRSFCQKCVSWQ